MQEFLPILAETKPHPLWQTIISSTFTWGLALGLLIAFFTWKSAIAAKGTLKREIRRLKEEADDLQKHLNTQLKINATGNEALQKENIDLKANNENLRVNLHEAQQKPGKQEMRQLQITESAVSIMRKQAPGFAPAWEQALTQAEQDREDAEGGFKKLVKKVIPGIGHSPSTQSKEVKIVDAESTDDAL